MQPVLKCCTVQKGNTRLACVRICRIKHLQREHQSCSRGTRQLWSELTTLIRYTPSPTVKKISGNHMELRGSCHESKVSLSLRLFRMKCEQHICTLKPESRSVAKPSRSTEGKSYKCASKDPSPQKISPREYDRG